MNLSNQVQNMLKLLKSRKTKVEINRNIKKEEYNFISDTIYISLSERIVQKGLESANPFCLKVLSMYKSYFRSKQSKILHTLLILLDNLSLIMTGMTILFRFSLGKSRGVCLLTILFISLEIALNLFVENNAYKRACKYLKKNISKLNDDDITKENVDNVEKLVKKNKLKLIINKEKIKIVMLVLVLILAI
ncbi:MAG: hypothetical protein IKL68_01810 [Clostridia bacterium]|nr:hypothetical protein [Clostridia bacterium]